MVCYLHDFEYDIFSGKLEKIPDKWADQSPEWKKSKDLTLFKVLEKDGGIFVEIP
jgi:nitrite reductase/ring-hydroxylating ferredoxin subunit